MVSREKWEASVEAWAWVFSLLQVLEGTTTKTKATSSTTTTTSKENRASCTGASRGRSVPAPEAEMAIPVLQNSLRSALHRAAAAAANRVGNPPLGIRIHTKPPPVTSEQYTAGLSQHPSGLSSGQGKQPTCNTTRRTRGDSGDFVMVGVPQAARDRDDHRAPNHQPALVTNEDPTTQVEQLKMQVQLGDCQGKGTCRRAEEAPCCSGVASDVHTCPRAEARANFQCTSRGRTA